MRSIELFLVSAVSVLVTGTLTAAEVALLRAGEAIAIVAVEPGTLADGSARISQRFWIGVAPVTVGQFRRFTDATGYRSEAETGTSGGFGVVDGRLVQRPGFTWRSPGFAQDDRHPVVLVTWGDAMAYCRFASAQSGRRVRLPTEAEWQLAAEGGGAAPASGAAPATALPWALPADPATAAGTQPIAVEPGHPLGLMALLGQVHQWCDDWHADAVPAGADPKRIVAPAGTARRVLRGGSFLRAGSEARVSVRWRNTPGSRNADNGFRIAVDKVALEPQSQAVPTTVPVVEPPPAHVPPPQPLQPHTPAPGSFSNGLGFSPGILVLIAPIILFVIMVIVLSAKKSSRPSARSAWTHRPAAPPVRLAADGFFPPATARRRQVRYRARDRDGQWHRGSCDLDADEEPFIYTGFTPQEVVITGIGLAAGLSAVVQDTVEDDDEEPAHRRRSSAGATAWIPPSAY